MAPLLFKGDRVRYVPGSDPTGVYEEALEGRLLRVQGFGEPGEALVSGTRYGDQYVIVECLEKVSTP